MNKADRIEAEAVIDSHEKEIEQIKDILASHYSNMLSVIDMLDCDSRIVKAIMMEFSVRTLSCAMLDLLEHGPPTDASSDILLEQVTDEIKKHITEQRCCAESSTDDSTVH